ncbi:hypothetical protein [Flavobacterium aquidurense]|jgi:hypothetical protein|uniref:hypothetical protein n=1 Tax=Flavobacterium aquidurense TaxID=362413 RepID=UPI0009178C0B|nr:hypothetical protein [Flavobacterium aquidurense]SHF99547.1 hypothetical protein SAMN05444481_101393 [Flavobacterium frigidimaris]
MDTTKTDNILFDSINISSLKSVVNIYQNKVNDNESKFVKLPGHFGLPLSVATFDNRVIGYAFVLINKVGEPEINSYWEQEFYSVEVEQDLKFHAQNTFNTTFADPESRKIKVQNATERLSSWLNFCN